MPQVQIQIVTWNSGEHLSRLFAGIRRQTVDYDLIVIDNASSDGAAEMIKNDFNVVSTPQNAGEKPLIPGITSYKGSLPPPFAKGGVETTKKVTLIANQENRGFAGGHNQGFAICRAPFVLALNPDVELGEGFLEKCLRLIQNDERIGAVTGKLYRRLPTLTPPSPLKGEGVSGIIDSCGLAMKPWGQIVNIGEGQPDRGQFDNLSTVFGVSGAAAFYRLEALKSVADKYGIFDERFGTYKEDADLAWRLRRAGWKTMFVPEAIACHPRAVRRDNRGDHSNVIRQLSLQNHLLMLKKNLSWRDWYRVPLIVGYELLKFIYVLVFERQNLKAFSVILNEVKDLVGQPRDSSLRSE